MSPKNIVAAFLFLCLLGYADVVPTPAGEPSPSEKIATSDAKVNICIGAAMKKIHRDLMEMKPSFPQLSAIEEAKVTTKCFSYSKGWVSDSKVDDAVFQKDGGDIRVTVAYPAKMSDIQQLMGSPFLRLANGKYLMYWTSVRAERTDQGAAFQKKVSPILSNTIREMLKQLGHKPKDYVFRLPDKE